MLQVEGVYTALITPFKGGAIDYEALKILVRRQLEAGIHGLVVLGSTGEAATVSFDEAAEVIRTVLNEVEGRVPVVVGAGSNATSVTVEKVRQARELGADAAMVVIPFYNKPTPAGILAHFKAVAEAVDLPLIAYNVPSRTGTNLTADTAAELSRLPSVIGLKEASGDMVQVMEIARRTRRDWSLLSGEDKLFWPILAVGGRGLIATSTNVAPERFVRIYDLWKAGEVEAACKAQLDLFDLISAMFRLTNPIPAKAACSLLGLCENELRLPLVPMEGGELERLRVDLKRMAVL